MITPTKKHLTNSPFRLLMLIIGLLLVCFSLVILVYFLLPNPSIEEIVPLSPTLFAPP